MPGDAGNGDTDNRELRILHREPLKEGPAAGRLLVLVHGVMDRATSFTRLMSKLPDWEILAYDRRGYAGSAEAGPPGDFQTQVDDLVSVLGDRQTVAFGHSLGGDVVLATVARHPGLITAALVWEPPQPWLPFWPDDTASKGMGREMSPPDRAEWLMRRLVGDHIWERLPSATRARRRAEGETLTADLDTLAGGPVFDPALVRVPVLVGRGGTSRPHHRRGARELAGLLPAGELVEIADAGHGAHLSHPRQIAELIRQVAGVQAPSSA